LATSSTGRPLGTDYLGTVIIRHRLTPALERAGGHIGYHVVPGFRRRGHATRRLAQAKLVCRELGLGEILVTCDEDNLGSRRVIEANGALWTGSSMVKPCTGWPRRSRAPEPDPGSLACSRSAPPARQPLRS
jgi:RimJ/RimL family protein N-acetyltransferase